MVLKWTGMVDNIALPEIAAAMLQQVIEGFEKEPLENEDLMRIGRHALVVNEECVEGGVGK